MGSISKSDKNIFEVKRIVQNLGTKESEKKQHNIRIAIQKINDLQLKSGQVFSFWHFVNFPTYKGGYLKSRAIQNNKILEEIGGGICQLSGLIYYLALHCNLEIIERHYHSIDIYKEEERFTPLGSDATVYFGYKDLVFINNQAVSFQFKLN